jgi:riboflavin synthase
MFTGLIEKKVKLVSLNKDVLTLDFNKKDSDIRIGESVSINGVCLTVINIEKALYSFEVSKETFNKSNLKKLKPGDFLNIEKSLKLNERLHGHFVTGHIDTTAIVKNIIKEDKYLVFEFFLNKASKYLTNKGSIAINGVSLTVNDVKLKSFKIYLIPHTIEITNLFNLKKEDIVNIEFDIIAKYVENMLKKDENRKSNVDEDFLRRNGYV